MFCPRCGQQAADEIRFCPKCGLPLTPHAALLAGHEPAPHVTTAPAQAPARTPKRVKNRRPAKLIFFSVALFPLFMMFSIAVDEPGPLIVPFLMFTAGLAWWIYTRMFGEDATQAAQQWSPGSLPAGGERPALGAPQFIPASLFNQQSASTSEIPQPRSVTENTTTLLDKDV